MEKGTVVECKFFGYAGRGQSHKKASFLKPVAACGKRHHN